MSGQVVRSNEPNIILGNDGTPIILTSHDLSTAANAAAADHATPPPEEDEADREKRELAISLKLWAKARRTGPPRKLDMNPIIIRSGRYIDQAACHRACTWFVEQGESPRGAWLHKHPRWTKWGHEAGREKREVVERDQMVMRILRNYSNADGPTEAQRDEALLLYSRIQTERRDEAAQKRKRVFGAIASRQDSVEAGGMVESRSAPGVEVPLGWNEEEGMIGAQEAVEADARTAAEQADEVEQPPKKTARKKK